MCLTPQQKLRVLEMRELYKKALKKKPERIKTMSFFSRNKKNKTFWIGLCGIVDAGFTAVGVPPPSWVHGVILALGGIFMRDAISKAQNDTKPGNSKG